MKIAIPTKHFNFRNGSSRVIHELALRLSARGDVVHIFCNRRPGTYEAGPVLRHVPMLPLGAWAKALSFNAVCAARIRREGFDLVHGQGNTVDQDLLTVHNCRMANRIARGRPVLRPDPHLWIERRQFGSSRLKRVITLSEMVKRDVHRHYGFPLDRIVVAGGGVDAERFHPRLRRIHRGPIRCEWGLKDEDLAVLFVASGNFVNRGLLNLFSAVRQRPAPRLKIVVVGGDRLAVFRTRAREQGLAERFIFRPFAARIEELHAGADALVFPSYYDAFGIVPLEAMASGLPVIVTAQCGVAEWITDGRNGLIVKHSEDLDGLANALAALEDPALRERLGREARAAAEGMTWDASIGKIMGVYREVLGDDFVNR